MSTTNQIKMNTLPFGGILLVILGLFILLEQIFDFQMVDGALLTGLGLIFILAQLSGKPVCWSQVVS